MSAAVGPCDCGWCKRYGNQDAASNGRPAIRNGHLVLDIHGRCTRCHYPLGERAYMVREHVLVHWIGDGGMHVYDPRIVPVCEVCVTDKELERRQHKTNCRGCGRLLHFGVWSVSPRTSLNGCRLPYSSTCSNACYRKALRKQRRPKTCECITCKTTFKSSRVDAQFCSSACRQWAYRLRAKAPAVAATQAQP